MQPTRARHGLLLLALSSLGLSTVPHLASTNPSVTASAGRFVGNTSIKDLDQFLGIPYAKPPVGELRFANPQPAGKLTSDPFDATAYGPGCLQDPLFADYNGLDEDCLTLNVIRPHDCQEDKLPVMFWIHGGGNMNGQSLYYNGTALTQFAASIDQPVIYVSINYRLGGFGFLTSTDFVDAGLSNLGLKDQYLALQWVHDNIESFGGDPDKVMIFGESAGAWNCWSQLHHAYTENEANKLFRGMVTQSGAPGSPQFPHAAAPETGAEAYAELLNATGCTGEDSAEARIDCLRAAPADSFSTLLTTGLTLPFTLDHDWFSKDLTDALVAGEMAPLPIIHGANLHEGSVFLPDPFNPPNDTDLLTHILESISAWSPDISSQTDSSPNLTAIANTLLQAYLDAPPTSLGLTDTSDPTAPATFWPAVGLYSDTTMHLGRRALLRRASDPDRQQPTWGYHFNQQPPLSQMNLSYEYPGNSQAYARRVGVQHGAELSYVFGEATSLEGRTQGDVDVSITMMRAWVNFAWWLDPNEEGDYSGKDEGQGQWPEYRAEGEQGTVMVFNEDGTERIGMQPDTQRQEVYDAWNQVRVDLGLGAIY